MTRIDPNGRQHSEDPAEGKDVDGTPDGSNGPREAPDHGNRALELDDDRENDTADVDDVEEAEAADGESDDDPVES